MKRLLAALAALLLLGGQAAAMDGADLLLKVDRNLQPEAFEMYRKLINIEPNGDRKEFVLYTVKKGADKVAAVFLDPPSEKGRATLRLGDNMWLYMPEVGKPIRITSLQSVTGGVFNNADILRLDFHVEYDVAKLSEEPDFYVLDLKAKTAEVAYDRLLMRVDKKALVPTTIEAYAVSGMLIKTLRYSDVKDLGDGIKRPAKVATDSPLYKGYVSEMLTARVKPRDLPDEVFTLNALPRIDELRK